MRVCLLVLLTTAVTTAEPRIWTRLDGSPVTGELVAVNLAERTVTIKTSSMTGILPIDAFSEADKVYIAEQLKRMAAAIDQPPKEKPKPAKLGLTCRECGTKTMVCPSNMSHRACEVATDGIGWTLGNVVIQEDGDLRPEQTQARCEDCRKKLAMALQAAAAEHTAPSRHTSKPRSKRPKRVIKPPQAVREDWRSFPEGL
jgi:hypothetical protein